LYMEKFKPINNDQLFLLPTVRRPFTGESRPAVVSNIMHLAAGPVVPMEKEKFVIISLPGVRNRTLHRRCLGQQ
jgi:hypothetical protein